MLAMEQIDRRKRERENVCRWMWVCAYRFCMSKIIFISFSTAAIFSADEGWGRPPNPRKDMFECGSGFLLSSREERQWLRSGVCELVEEGLNLSWRLQNRLAKN